MMWRSPPPTPRSTRTINALVTKLISLAGQRINVGGRVRYWGG
jgi:hypothetical protein